MDFTTIGVQAVAVQAVAAAAAVGVLWFAARKDSRDARTDFQRSIKTLMAPKLEILQGKIDSIRNEIDNIRHENMDIKTRLNSIDDHLRKPRDR